MGMKFKIKKISLRKMGIAMCLLLYLLLFLFLFGLHAIDASNLIDGSWMLSLSSLRHGSQTLGADIFFTYGPLYVKIMNFVHPLDTARDLFIANIYFVTLLILCSFSFYEFIKKWVINNIWLLALVLGLILLILTIYPLDTLFYATLLFSVLAARKETKYWKCLLILMGPALFAMYKFSFLLSFAAITPFIFLHEYNLSKLINSFLKWLGTFGLLIIGFLLTTGTVFGFAKYLYYGTINSIYFNEYMSLPFDFNKNLVISYSLALAVMFLFTITTIVFLFIKNRSLKVTDNIALVSVTFITIYFAYKQSVVRSDAHLFALTPFFFIMAIFCSYIAYYFVLKKYTGSLFKFRRGTKHITVICFLSLFFIVSYFAHYKVYYIILKTPKVSIANFINDRLLAVRDDLYSNKFRYSVFEQRRIETTNLINMHNKLVGILNQQIKDKNLKQDVLLYGNPTILASLVKTNGNVIQAPFIQLYPAYPPSLFESMYANYYKNHSDALVYATDMNAAIDGRLSTHELSNTFQYLIHNYVPIASDSYNEQYLLKQKSNLSESCNNISIVSAQKNRDVLMPKTTITNNDYLKIKVKYNNYLESIISLAIKKPVYSMLVTGDDGKKLIWRTHLSALNNGVSINPIYVSYHTAIDGKKFNTSSFKLIGGIDKNDKYEVTFEKCTFK
jgi:hypothetical protein